MVSATQDIPVQSDCDDGGGDDEDDLDNLNEQAIEMAPQHIMPCLYYTVSRTSWESILYT